MKSTDFVSRAESSIFQPETRISGEKKVESCLDERKKNLLPIKKKVDQFNEVNMWLLVNCAKFFNETVAVFCFARNKEAEDGQRGQLPDGHVDQLWRRRG